MPLFDWIRSDLHSLNLDWIISKIKTVEESEQGAVDAAANAKASKTAAAASATAANNSKTAAAGSATAAAGSAAQAQALVDQLDTTIAQDVTDWLDEHITHTTPAVDNTLTVSGAAADAAVTGDKITELKTNLDDTQDWLGFPKNLFNAREITITNSNNWSIDEATKTSITITHKTEFTSGAPKVTLSLPTGNYIFKADYSNSSAHFSLYVNGSWVKELTDGAALDLDSANTNEMYFTAPPMGTYIITDINITDTDVTGKIPVIESSLNPLETEVSNLHDGFNDIADPVISEIDGIETENTVVNQSGSIVPAGSANYRTVKYEVLPGKAYLITANTNWGNLLWAFYDENNTLIQKGEQSASVSADTIVTEREATAPQNSKYCIIAYNVTVRRGYVETQTGYSVAKKWDGKKWVCVGDSLTAENIRTTKHYFDYVAEETGIETVNMGYSGSGYARLANENHAFYQRISACPTDADVVTIFGSFNDLGAGLPIGTVNDTGTDTLAGCINTTITNLQTVIPLVNLGIVSPTPWDTTQPTTSGQDYNYVEMLKAICERRSIPFLDLWRCSNLRPWDADFRELAYSKDGGSGTHPDENGHKLIAPRFKGFLETLLM